MQFAGPLVPAIAKSNCILILDLSVVKVAAGIVTQIANAAAFAAAASSAVTFDNKSTPSAAASCLIAW